MKRLDGGFWYYFDVISEDIIVCRDNCILGHAENEKLALEIIERFKGYKESK